MKTLALYLATVLAAAAQSFTPTGAGISIDAESSVIFHGPGGTNLWKFRTNGVMEIFGPSGMASLRVVATNGTNALVIGVGGVTNVIELRAEEMLHRGRALVAPDSTNSVERAALRASLKGRVNNNQIPPGQAGQALAELVRLLELDDADEMDKKKPK